MHISVEIEEISFMIYHFSVVTVTAHHVNSCVENRSAVKTISVGVGVIEV